MDKKEEQKSSWLLIGAGSMLTAMILAGFGLGYLLDSWLGTRPWMMLALGAMGFVGGVLRLLRLLV